MPPRQDKPVKKKSGARMAVETVLTVLVVVVVVRGFLIEPFKIPTGSMEPALLGNPYHGDRVLAWKPAVRWGEPERWSVNVFRKHPDPYERSHGETSTRTFIKRTVGLPGERVYISGGDIYTDTIDEPRPRIARKPAHVQEPLWHLVYEGGRLEKHWVLEPGLTPDGDAVSADSPGQTWARFAMNNYPGDDGIVTNLYVRELRLRLDCPVESCAAEVRPDISTAATFHVCPDCGESFSVLEEGVVPEDITFRYPPYPADEEAVSDIRVRIEVAPSEARGAVMLELSRDSDIFLARLPLAGGRATATGPDGLSGSADVAPLPVGHASRVSFAHVDGSLVLTVNETEVLRVEYELSWEARAGGPRTNRVRFGVENASARITPVAIERDIHYLALGGPDVMEFFHRGRWSAQPAFEPTGVPVVQRQAQAVRLLRRLDSDQYLMLGDNSPSSYDARMWGPTRAQDLVGKAFAVWWPPSRGRILQ